ncbi:MAG: RluA family pseudouridine synthase [Deltaproteobacteria bacterium]|nr:RluA family pseudouridine synthase [Deltaproteobacteria bacterium]
MRVVVPADSEGLRLDRFLANALPSVTRAQVQRWITDGCVRRGEVVSCKPAQAVRAGESIEVTPPLPRPIALLPEEIPLDILHEDSALIVVNKPAGMVVHPGAGRSSGTLVNALLAHCSDLTGVGDRLRPGIVHRLDKGTSGVMVVAKTHAAHAALIRQFEARTVEKVYLAIVLGRIAPTGRMAAPIGRHPSDRKKMSVAARRGREALTTWQVRESFGQEAALLEVRLGTGRTHQVRVHLAAKGHPLVGDPTYGGTGGLRRLPAPWRERLATFSRPALHAWRLGFIHPATGAEQRFEAPLPDDMRSLIDTCRGLSKWSA